MTLILEFERKLIFYRPGILRYAMRRAGMQPGEAQDGAERRELLSQSLKRGWDEAKAEMAALQRLQALVPQERDELLRHRLDAAVALSQAASPIALAPRQIQ